MSLASVAARTKRVVLDAPGPPYVLRALLACGGLGLLGALLSTGLVRCPTALLLRIPCPACGTTRAAHALLVGDVATALRIQPAAPLVALLFATLAARGIWLVWREGNARALMAGTMGKVLSGAILVAAVVEVVVWTVRWFGMLGGPVAV
jgi:hypothetical protein